MHGKGERRVVGKIKAFIRFSCNWKRVVSFIVTFNLLVLGLSIGLYDKARGFFRIGFSTYKPCVSFSLWLLVLNWN